MAPVMTMRTWEHSQVRILMLVRFVCALFLLVDLLLLPKQSFLVFQCPVERSETSPWKSLYISLRKRNFVQHDMAFLRYQRIQENLVDRVLSAIPSQVIGYGS